MLEGKKFNTDPISVKQPTQGELRIDRDGTIDLESVGIPELRSLRNLIN
jgi:hypothetical protein